MAYQRHVSYDEASEALMFYHREHQARTVRALVSRWAPAVDGNDTARFIDQVSMHLAVAPDDPVNLDEPGRVQAFIRSLDACGLMFRHPYR